MTWQIGDSVEVHSACNFIRGRVVKIKSAKSGPVALIKGHDLYGAVTVWRPVPSLTSAKPTLTAEQVAELKELHAEYLAHNRSAALKWRLIEAFPALIAAYEERPR